MSRPYPEYAAFDNGHPLVGPGRWLPAADARSRLSLWCDFRSSINSVFLNQASSDNSGLTWGTLDTPRPQVGTIDGRPGLSLAGLAKVNFPPECGVPANTGFLTVWCRFVLHASPANGSYTGVFNQWNNGGNTTAYQAFEIGAFNNVFGRPARTIEINCLMDDSSFCGAAVQYAAADIGSVWTAVGVADGAAVRFYLFTRSGLLVGTTHPSNGSTYSPPRVIHGSSVGQVSVGQQDGNYANITVLGCGIWPGRALTEQQIHELHLDPWRIITPKQWKRRLGKPPTAAPAFDPSAGFPWLDCPQPDRTIPVGIPY